MVILPRGVGTGINGRPGTLAKREALKEAEEANPKAACCLNVIDESAYKPQEPNNTAAPTRLPLI